MKISRRQLFAGGVALGGLPALRADQQRIAGLTAHWSGWRSPANQIVTFGFWYVVDGEWIRYATTLGSVGRCREMQVLDLSRREGWPVIRSESDEMADPVKALALKRLAIAIETGEFEG